MLFNKSFMHWQYTSSCKLIYSTLFYLINLQFFHCFQGSQQDLILTFHRSYYGGAVHGILQLTNNSFYSIEFVEYGLHAFKTLQNVESGTRQLSLARPPFQSRKEGSQVRSPTGGQSVVTVYIKFYYTEKFYESTDDVNGFIDKLISQINILLKVNVNKVKPQPKPKFKAK